MKLHYSPGACALADHIVLEWIGEPYETQGYDRKDLKSPGYLRLNPNGQVPVLEDRGWTLTQNVAILNYLVDTHPEARLGGDGSPRDRAEVNRWLGFVNADMHPLFKPLFGYSNYLGEAATAKVRKHSEASLRKLFAIADEALADRGWIAGARSIADPYLFVVLRWAQKVGVDLSGLDNLKRFFARMLNDAAVQKVLDEEGIEPVGAEGNRSG